MKMRRYEVTVVVDLDPEQYDSPERWDFAHLLLGGDNWHAAIKAVEVKFTGERSYNDDTGEES